MPPEDPNTLVRGDLVKGFMYVEHIDQDSCWFHGYINFNPKFAYLPDWLLNFSVKRIMYVMIGRIQNKEVFEKESLKKRIEERKEYYDKIRDRIRQVTESQ